MPSPIGHALAGVAAGCALDGPRPLRGRPAARRLLAFGLLGALPDVDVLFGLHSMYTHSVGAAAVAGTAAALLGGRFHVRAIAAAAAACGSHVLLDWLGVDDVAPYGVMALWPFSGAYLISDRRWFTAVCREYRQAGCWLHNARGVLRELAILGPVTAGVLAWRGLATGVDGPRRRERTRWRGRRRPVRISSDDPTN